MDLARRAPESDQLEVTLVGPGYGECVLLHLGNGRWVVVDSCIDSASGQPAPLEYLERLGISPSEAVDLIVATHWHDDHIRGLATTLRECSNARFCASSALTEAEFLAMVEAYDSDLMTSMSSGVREIREVLRVLEASDRQLVRAVSDRLIFRLEAEQSGHGQECRISSLSPSDFQVDGFYKTIARLMPKVQAPKRRCVPTGPNNTAVVMWVAVGEAAILLGSDLEETSDPNSGWSVIVESSTRPRGAAAVFKVPHHGSATSHNDQVWSNMLGPQPDAILTPYARGRSPLPTNSDVERIANLSERSYITSRPQRRRMRRGRPSAVERTLREAGVRVERAEPATGAVRLRNGGAEEFDSWTIELSSEACQLEALR